MILSFILSMPSNNAWNGNWTGEGTLYAKVVNFGKSAQSILKAKTILDKGYYTYNFGDGWRAGVSVAEVTAREAARIRRKTSGFCGYDWMIYAIRLYGTIVAPSDRKRALQETEND